jgi:RHS repeat-associated protein
MRKFTLTVLALFGVSIAAWAQDGTGLVRHAPIINGAVDGSLQVLLPESFSLNSGASLSGELQVSGLPRIWRNGSPSVGAVIDGSGAMTPDNYGITLNGGVSIGRIVRRTDAVAMAAVDSPAVPGGSRSISINSTGQSPGNWATIGNLTLNSGVGLYSVPPGSYGNFTANSLSGFVLGVAGAAQPAVYSFQQLVLNGQSELRVVGPVVITVGSGVTLNGTCGVAEKPAWLSLLMRSGGVTLNGGSKLYGYVSAPDGTVIVNGNTQFVGGLACDRLILNSGGVLRLKKAQADNQPPEAIPPGQVSTDEDTPVAIVLGGRDPEGASLVYRIVTAPGKGMLSGSAPNLVYTPSLNSNGADSFSYSVSDGVLESAPVTVSIMIAPVNDAPVALSASLGVKEGDRLPVALGATDADGDALSYSIVMAPKHGVLTGTAPDLVYRPDANYGGPDAIVFTASDGKAESAPATIAIQVTNLNDPPSAQDAQVDLAEDERLSLTLSGGDPDGDVFSFVIVSQPAHGMLTGSGANWTYSPEANYNGVDQFSFKTRDSGGLESVTATVRITVKPVNDAPIAKAQTLETKEDTALTIELGAVDIDGDALSFVLIAAPAHGVLSGTAPQLTYTPAKDYNGSDAFSFKANDGIADSEAAQVSIKVTPVNDAPVALEQSLQTNRNTPLPLTLGATDADGDDLSYEIIQGPSNGTLSGTAPNLVYTPNAGFRVGTDSFTFRASDKDTSSTSATVSIQVLFSNKPPVISAIPNGTTLEDTPVAVEIPGSDPDGDSISYKVSSPASHGTVVIDGTRLIYTPKQDFFGTDGFSIVANDGTVDSAQSVVAISVQPVNDAPVAQGQKLQAKRNTPLPLSLVATDADLDPLSYEIVRGPKYGSLSGSAPDLIYTPNTDSTNPDEIVFRASDGKLVSNEAVVSLEVISPGAPPPLSAGGEQSVVVSAISCNRRGTVVVNSDEWTLSNQGLTMAPGAANFARNLASWFKRGDRGRFLVYSSVFGLIENRLQSLMLAEGHEWAIRSDGVLTAEILKKYDAVFLSGLAVDPTLLKDYVAQGGGVYICGRGSDQDPVLWNDFLSSFGLVMAGANPVVAVTPIQSTHPLFKDVDSLYFYNGNKLSLLTVQNSGSSTEVLHAASGYDLISASVTGRHVVDISGRFLSQPDGFDPQAVKFEWTVLSQAGLVRFDDPKAASTRAYFEKEGDYRLLLTASNTFGSVSAELLLHLVINQPPQVEAGPDVKAPSAAASVPIQGLVSDDGKPEGQPLVGRWSIEEGPVGATASFTPDSTASATAVFSQNGRYLLRLDGSDSVDTVSDLLEARIGVAMLQPADGLVAWWPFDRHARDVVSDRHTVLNARFASGQVLKGLKMDGYDRLSVPGDAAFDVGLSPTGFSLEFWMRTDSKRDEVLLSFYGESSRRLVIQRDWYGGQRLSFKVYDASGAEKSIQSGDLFMASSVPWTHVAAIYDRVTGLARLFVDGRLVASGEWGQLAPRSLKDLYFGYVPDTDVGFKGTLDEVSLYSRPLSVAEVRAVHLAGANGKAPLGSGVSPRVEAGPNQIIDTVLTATLSGTVADDDLPFGAPVVQWAQVDGPGSAVIAAPASTSTGVEFPRPGTYLFRLTADDRYHQPESDLVELRVGVHPTAVPKGVMAWWSMNGHSHEVTQGIADLSMLNGADYVSGKVLQGIGFDGVDDYAQVSANPKLDVGASAEGFSVEFWFKADSKADQPFVLFHGAGRRGLAIVRDWYGGQRISFSVYDSSGAEKSVQTGDLFTSSTVPWTHVVATYDRTSGAAKVYVNGEIMASTIWGAVRPQTLKDLFLAYAPDSDSKLKGAMDELTLYSRPLNASEISALFSAGLDGKIPPPSNIAPVVNAGPDAYGYVGVPLSIAGTVTDDGLPNPPGVIGCQWTQVSGPGVAKFANATASSTTVTFDAAGDYVLRLTGSDSAASASDDVQIVVTIPQSAPPTASWNTPRDGSRVPVNTKLTLEVRATDSDGSIAKVEFFQGSTKLGEQTLPAADDRTIFFWAIPAGLPLGNYTFTSKVTDNSGVSVNVSPLTISAIADPGPAVTDLVTPAESSRISAPTAVTGVVSTPFLLSWETQYRLKVADGETPGAWLKLSSGEKQVGIPASDTAAAVPESLGSFDPTLLLNGIYELRLVVVTTAGEQIATAPLTVLVEGNMKIGAFSLAFEDLKLPVAGIPITVTRTYDSRDARVGDFGPGWRLALSNIRVQKNRHLGKEWWQTPQSGDALQFYDVLPVSDRIVTIVMPDGETHRFSAGVLVKNRDGDPDHSSFGVLVRTGKYRFYPLGDTSSKLEPLDSSNQLAESFWIGGTGTQDLMTEEYGFEFFNPTRFRLTTKEGTMFILDEKQGLLEMRDLQGNTLSVSTDKVTAVQNAPSGPITRSISIHRDASNRVDYIQDSSGQSLDYSYDDQGRLSSFTDRELNITQFKYENAKFPHYLTKIIDPRGTTAIRSEYDDAGRLVKQIDASGKETVFDRGIDASGRFEKVTDRLGNATTYYYDDRGNVVQKVDSLGAKTSFSYYADTDRVKFETDHYGNVKSFAYDVRGNVIAETIGASTSEDPAAPSTGQTTRTVYNDFSAPTQITDPQGRVQSFTYAAGTSNLLSHTLASGTAKAVTTRFTYASDGALSTVTDALGNVSSYSYDYAFSDAAYPGAVKQVTVMVKDPAGAAGTDASNASDTLLRTTRYLYDAQENQVAQIAIRTLSDGTTQNIVTRFSFDKENRLRATFQPDARVSETRYTSFGKPEKAILWKSAADYSGGDLSKARVTSYSYDDRGNQTGISFPDSTTEQSHYDAENRKDWSQDQRGYRSFYVYDASGRLRFTIHPDANDGTGSSAPTSPTDSKLADNPRTETVYDLVGRVTDSYDELRAHTGYVYYPDGSADAFRRKQLVQYRTAPAASLTTSYEYDKSGNVTKVTDPRGATVETLYDEQGRPWKTIYPATDENLSTQIVTEYDAIGRRVAVTDQEGKLTRYRYDALGRLVEVRQYLDQSLAASDSSFALQPSAQGLVSTRYAYDELGNQLTQTDALGRVTAYEYDAAGRRTKRLLPKDSTESTTLTESLQYDDWGQLWKKTDFSGKTTVFDYDLLGRLKTKTADATHPSLSYGHAIAKVSYTYDANGARVAASTENKDGTVLYTESTPRDARGRMETKEAQGIVLGYEYYANGLLKDTVSTRANGVNVGYRYDELNRLAYVDESSGSESASGSVRTHSYAYNANGSLETLGYSNGIQHAYTYDTLNRLRTLKVSYVPSGGTISGTELHAYECKLSPGGHRRQVLEAAKTTSYSYDSLYRLTGETVVGAPSPEPAGTVSYTLDKVGNRENRFSDLPGVLPQLSRSYNARDWLTGDSYDTNGNTVSGSILDANSLLLAPSGTDVYDFENRLIVRQKADGSVINLAYDADGIRVGKTFFDPTGALVRSTSYLVDTNNLTGYAQVLEEKTAESSASVLTVYTYGSGLIRAQRIDSSSSLPTSRYYLTDAGGSVRELADDTGAITDRYIYDAFGVLIAKSGTSPNCYLYRSEQWDTDLGLYYNRARYLNTDSGRFWNQDEYEGRSADPATLHKYLYANADPVMFTDPSGHFSLVELAETMTVQGYVRAMAYPKVFSVISFTLSLIIPAEVQIGLPSFGAGGGLAAIESAAVKELPALRRAWLNADTIKEAGAAGRSFEAWVGKVLQLEKNTQAFKGGREVAGGTLGGRIPDFFVSAARQSIVEVKSASFSTSQAQEFAQIAVNRGLGLTYVFLKNPGAAAVKELRAAVAKVAPDLEVAVNVVFP